MAVFGGGPVDLVTLSSQDLAIGIALIILPGFQMALTFTPAVIYQDDTVDKNINYSFLKSYFFSVALFLP